MRPVISCDAPITAAAAELPEVLLDERSSLFVPLSLLLLPVKDTDDSLPPSGTRGGRFLDLTGSMVFGAPSYD